MQRKCCLLSPKRVIFWVPISWSRVCASCSLISKPICSSYILTLQPIIKRGRDLKLRPKGANIPNSFNPSQARIFFQYPTINSSLVRVLPQTRALLDATELNRDVFISRTASDHDEEDHWIKDKYKLIFVFHFQCELEKQNIELFFFNI